MHIVYALGSNGFGQLGVGHFEDCSSPQRVQIERHEDCNGIKCIVAGGNHSLLLLENGQTLACGNNDFGQCAQVHTTHARSTIPSPITVGQGLFDSAIVNEIEQVSATWNASVFVTKDQKVLVAGQGLNGELGLGLGQTEATTLTTIPDFPPSKLKISSMSSSLAHTVCVLSNGSVYGWGRGRKGQLGQPSEDVWQPRKVNDIPFTAKGVACGKDFSCILGSEGQILMLGPNRQDRFGVKADAPGFIFKDAPDRNIFASWGSVFAVGGPAQTQRFLVWGRNDHGQLGPSVGRPTVRSLTAGSEHCLALTSSEQLIAWGWGEHGNCGLPIDDAGDVKGRWNTIRIPHRPLKVFAGCATSFILAEGSDNVIQHDTLADQSKSP